MPRSHGGHRSLTVLRNPEPEPRPASCRVCGDRRVVAVVRLLDPAISGSGRVRCPHCAASPGEMPIPIYTYSPYSGDLPEGGDAA